MLKLIEWRNFGALILTSHLAPSNCSYLSDIRTHAMETKFQLGLEQQATPQFSTSQPTRLPLKPTDCNRHLFQAGCEVLFWAKFTQELSSCMNFFLFLHTHLLIYYSILSNWDIFMQVRTSFKQWEFEEGWEQGRQLFSTIEYFRMLL